MKYIYNYTYNTVQHIKRIFYYIKTGQVELFRTVKGNRPRIGFFFSYYDGHLYSLSFYFFCINLYNFKDVARWRVRAQFVESVKKIIRRSYG